MRTLSHATIALCLFLAVPAAARAGGHWSAHLAQRFAAAEAPVAAQDGERDERGRDEQDREGTGDDPQIPEPQVAVRSKADVLGRKLLEAHGGIEALNAFTSLQFTVTPVLVRPVESESAGGDSPEGDSQEGDTQDGDTQDGESQDGEPAYEEIRRAPITFEASFSGEARSMRMDEPIQIEGREHTTTKILVTSEQGNQVHFLLDGNERTIIPEQRAQITEDIQTLAGQFDILLGLGTGQLVGSYDGTAERDGVEYETVVAQFFGGLQREKTFRLYIDPESNLVARYDLFNTDTRRLMNKLRIADYATYEGLQLPGAITFHNRRDVPFMRWEFTDYRVNAEIAPERFVVQ